MEDNGGGRILPREDYRDSRSEELTFELRSKGPNFLRRGHSEGRDTALGKSGMSDECSVCSEQSR